MKFNKLTKQEKIEKSKKVIHLGFPMYFYDEENILWGFWSFIHMIFPMTVQDEYGEPTFAFIIYKGSYWTALLNFLSGNIK